jgi:hypothetical protein
MSGMRLAAMVGVAFLAACGGTARVCTVIGCPFAVDDGVMVFAPAGVEIDPASLTVCIDGDCESPVPFPDADAVPAGALLVVVPGAGDGDDVRVTLDRPDGTKLTGSAAIHTSLPNGEGCGECNTAEVSLEAE